MIEQLNVEDLAKLPHKQQVQVAVYAAELVADLVQTEHRPLFDKAIKTVKAWLKGEASAEECGEMATAVAAIDTRYNTQSHNTRPPDVAVRTADWAAYAVACGGHNGLNAVHWAILASPNTKETKDKIYTYYDNLLNVDKYVEEAFLGGDL